MYLDFKRLDRQALPRRVAELQRFKLKLLVDSVTSFSYVPIRMMSYLGCIIALLGFLYTLVVSVNGLAGRTPTGWATLTALVLVLGGIQMLMLGLLGEYVWRTLDESRRRPRYLIEETTTVAEAQQVERPAA